MEKNQEQVYALILNYNSADETIELFRNLAEQLYKNLKVLVIDNKSKEEDKQKLKKNLPEKNLIFNEQNLGFAAGNNIGIQRAMNAGADYVWILNPDVRVEKDVLSLLIETIKKNKKIAAVGSRILQRENPGIIFSDGEKMIMDKKASTLHKNHNLKAKYLKTGIDYNIDYIAGCSMLLNTLAIEEVGLLPEEYFLYFEETDWCFKAKKSDWKLAINTNATVYNLTSKKTSVFHYYFVRNKLIFCKKYHPDFKSVRNYQVRVLKEEIISRSKGKYLRPFFKARLKGLFSGIIKTSL